MDKLRILDVNASGDAEDYDGDLEMIMRHKDKNCDIIAIRDISWKSLMRLSENLDYTMVIDESWEQVKRPNRKFYKVLSVLFVSNKIIRTIEFERIHTIKETKTSLRQIAGQFKFSESLVVLKSSNFPHVNLQDRRMEINRQKERKMAMLLDEVSFQAQHRFDNAIFLCKQGIDSDTFGQDVIKRFSFKRIHSTGNWVYISAGLENSANISVELLGDNAICVNLAAKESNPRINKGGK